MTDRTLQVAGLMFQLGNTVALGILTWLIARQQSRMAQTKLRHEQYERRLRLYTELREFLAHIVMTAHVDDEKIRTFLRNTRESVFVFDKGIEAYLKEIYHEAIELQRIQSELQPLPTGDERTELAQQKGKTLKWFTEQAVIAQDKFYKFLSLS